MNGCGARNVTQAEHFSRALAREKCVSPREMCELIDVSSTRRVETDALVDGCELSEEAPTVETTERGR